VENCEYWQEQISALLDGELSAQAETALLTHLDGCESCRTYYDALTALAGTVERDLPAPPAELTGRIMDAVRAQAAPKEEKKAKVVSFARYARSAALAAAAALVIWAGVRIMGPKGAMNTAEAPQAAMSAVTASGADEDAVFMAEEPAAAREETAFSAESYAADTEIWEDAEADAAPAEAENGLAAPAPESRDAGAPLTAYTLYSGGESLARGELDGEALSLLLTADKPASVPDRTADYTLTLTSPEGETEIWSLWEENGALLCRKDGESAAGWTLSAEDFWEMFKIEE